MYWERAVSVECAGRVGAGCVVAPGLVLTAFHVVEPAGPDQAPPSCTVGLIGSPVRAAAEVTWHLEDAALLRFRPADLPREFAPVRWGEIVCISPSRPARCAAVGLPIAAEHRVESWAPGTGRAWREPEVVEGHINAVDTGGRSYSLQADSAVPTGRPRPGTSPWAGMSGAGVFHEDLLVGTVQRAVADRGNARLEAVPARRLLDDRGFCDILEQAGGTRPQLEPADLHILFDSPPQPAVAASYLLAARSETVEFTGLDTELQNLHTWCHGPRAVDVAVVYGPGGVGKTRLAVELARRLADRRPQAETAANAVHLPWSTGFLDHAALHHDAYSMLRHLIRPALIVVDYAEYHLEQVKALLNALANHRAPGHRIRILLLARSTRKWWPKLRATHPAAVGGTEIVLTPDNLLRQVDASELRERARMAFARRIAALHWSGVPDDWDAEEVLGRTEDPVLLQTNPAHHGPASVLSLHMESLAAVLADHPLGDTLDPHEVLLYHEEKYWDRAAAALLPQPMDPDHRQVLVAVQRLTGALDQQEADAAIRTAWAAHHADDSTAPPLTRDSLLAQRRFLTALYPPTGRAYWGGIGPDTLTARLIDEIEQDAAFLARTLSHPLLSPVQRRHCLAIVGRCILSHPALAHAAAQAVTAAPHLLSDDAQELLEKLPGSARDIWRVALADAEQHDAAASGPTGPGGIGRPQRLDPSPGSEEALPPIPPVRTATAVEPAPLRLPLPPMVKTTPISSLPTPAAPDLPQPPSRSTKPQNLPARRTVPVAIRDYFGLDAQGLRQVLAAAAILVVLVAAAVFLL